MEMAETSIFVEFDAEKILRGDKWIDSVEFAADWISDFSKFNWLERKTFHGDLCRFHGISQYPSPYSYLIALHYYRTYVSKRTEHHSTAQTKSSIVLMDFLMCLMLAYKFLEEVLYVPYSQLLSSMFDDIDYTNRREWIYKYEKSILEALDYNCDVKMHELDRLIQNK